MDGVLAIGGCDKNMPGAMIAIARLDIPAIFVYGGTIKPGQLRRPGPDDRERVRGGRGSTAPASIARERLRRDRAPARCPGAGSCGGMYTANTMSSGDRGARAEPARLLDDGGRGRREGATARAESARVLVDGSRRATSTPREIMTRKAFENAIAVVMAVGGSTNAVLHLLADRARGRGAARRSTTSRRIRAQRAGALRPEAVRDVRRDRSAPRRRHSAGDEDAARRTGSLHGDCIDDHGQDGRGEPRGRARRAARGPGRDAPLRRARSTRRPPRDPARQPRAARARSRRSRGVKRAAITRPGARVRVARRTACAAILADRIQPGDVIVIRYEGPKGGPGMREMLSPTSALIGKGLGDSVGLHHRRPLLRRHLRHGRRARRARGRGGRHDRARARGRLDHDRRRASACCSSTCPTPSSQRRRAAWKPPAPRYPTRRAGEVRAARRQRRRAP